MENTADNLETVTIRRDDLETLYAHWVETTRNQSDIDVRIEAVLTTNEEKVPA